MSNNKGKDLLSFMRENGLDKYGDVISAEIVRITIGLEYPEIATQQEFNALALAELGAVDYVRNALLNEGKYFKAEGSAYRILLPSENAAQISAYMASAEKKLKRAIKLDKNTPSQLKEPLSNNTAARAMMKLSSIKRSL